MNRRDLRDTPIIFKSEFNFWLFKKSFLFFSDVGKSFGIDMEGVGWLWEPNLDEKEEEAEMFEFLLENDCGLLQKKRLKEKKAEHSTNLEICTHAFISGQKCLGVLSNINSHASTFPL